MSTEKTRRAASFAVPLKCYGLSEGGSVTLSVPRSRVRSTGGDL